MNCPVCAKYFELYGFSLFEGLKARTQTEQACCPVKCEVTYFDKDIVRYKTTDGHEHSKSFVDFMKSSYIDRTEYL